jgi:hypothetical protein
MIISILFFERREKFQVKTALPPEADRPLCSNNKPFVIASDDSDEAVSDSVGEEE